MSNKELFMAGKPFTMGMIETQFRYVAPTEDSTQQVIEVDSFPGLTEFRFFCKVLKVDQWDYKYQFENPDGRKSTGTMKYESLNFNIPQS